MTNEEMKTALEAKANKHYLVLREEDFSQHGLDLGIWDSILDAFQLPPDTEEIAMWAKYSTHY